MNPRCAAAFVVVLEDLTVPQHTDSHAGEVASDRDAITRESVAALRTDLTEGSGSIRRGTSALIESMEASLGQGTGQGNSAKSMQPVLPSPDPMPCVPRAVPLRLLASLDGIEVVVDTLQAPPQAGQVFVTPVNASQTQTVPASELVLVGWLAR